MPATRRPHLLGLLRPRLAPLALVWVAAALATGVSGCRGDGAVTAVRVAAEWPAEGSLDQLEFSLFDVAGKTLLMRTPRPTSPGPALQPGADVLIYLPDGLAGTEVVAEVAGLSRGVVVGTGKAEPVMVRARTVVATRARLSLDPRAISRQPDGKVDGDRCATGSECASGHCVDGTCCDTACAGVCQACNVPGKRGTCAAVPAGVRHSACAAQAPESCGYDGTCDGKGECRKHPSGTRCSAGECSGSSITSSGACDGTGRCVPGPVITCAPFNCNPSASPPGCFSSCTKNSDCVEGRECMGGSCGKKPDGATCSDPAECSSGFCADGVCCESKCDGACLSCAQVGMLGMCRPVAAGVADPRGVCKDEPPCGNTGACDGKGTCARYPVGSACTLASCASSSVLMSAGRCDATGNCQPGGMLSCAPFVCRSGACVSSCTSNNDCAAGAFCDPDKSCGKKGLGQPCGAAGECASGFCVDGVCCDEACGGSCRTCSGGRAQGVCSFVPAGAQDPRRICRDAGPASCGQDGTCNGAGGCRRYAVGTVCSGGSCTGNVRTLPSSCDTAGRCTAGGQVSCGAYRCNGSVCFTGCSSDTNCVAPNVCISGTCGQRGSGQTCSRNSECMSPLTCVGSICQLRPAGWSCTAANQCASGSCTEGVCCDAADCGRCRSCKVPGFIGYCHPVPAGTPDGRCSTDAVSTCRQDGTCDGGGGCRLYLAGTECAPASCSGQYRLGARSCDGSGVCLDASSVDCAPFLCDPSTNACFASCTRDDQCVRRCFFDSCRR